MSDDRAAPGVLYVVATPIGNLEDLSERARRVLGEVDIVAAEDTRRASNLLNYIGVRAPKLVSLFEGNEAARSEELAAALQRGDNVAVISEAGLPSVSDPGERAVRAAIEIGARVEVIPGPVAAVTALVGSGLRAQPFAFYGFPPRQQGARRELFGSLRAAPTTLVFYEAPDRVGATLADLRDALGADRRAALARELTKVHEEYVRGALSELAERYANSPPRGECTIVVEGADGPVDEIDAEAAVRELIGQGFGPKDVAARLVVTTGKPKRQLYQLALSIARELKPSD